MRNVSKNYFQKIFAILLLILTSPLFLFVGLLILFLTGRPIIYKQYRYGEKFSKFIIFKFRTMKVSSTDSLANYDDIRITKIGHFLRIFKLDELPQLINIIKGEMYFVGPRPELIKIIDRKKELFDFLNNIKPGITDISSIIFKNESKIFKTIPLIHYETTILPIKIKLVEIFMQKKNIFNDFLIIILTLTALFNHTLAVKIIKKIFLSDLELEFRIKLNHVLLKQIF